MSMSKRLKLQEILEDILGSEERVYFQPPPSLIMKYPAIVYSKADILNHNANNDVYLQTDSYQVVVIDEDPDSDISERVSKIPTIRFDRHYAADNLNHDVYSINL